MEVANRCVEMEFSMIGKEGEGTIERVALLKYLGRPLEQSDDNWPAVRQNIGRAQQVWGRLGFILRQEGADPFALAAF